MTRARGGRWNSGFWAGFAGTMLSPVTEMAKEYYAKVASSAVVAGTDSSITGGKFANGAFSGAFRFMFNEMGHISRRYLLGIHTNVSSREGFAQGHAWISVTDTEKDTFHTYGLWADEAGLASNGSGGVEVDLEMYRHYKFESNYFVGISQEQYNAIAPMLVEGTNSWWVTYTCAEYARDVFYMATHRYLDADDYFGIETPRELAKAIGN